MPLTDDQQKAKDEILARVQMGTRHISLTGYAGTGKTFLTGHLVEELDQRETLYACAPTHKAAYVLDGELPIETTTVHSFLNLRLTRDKKGGYAIAPYKQEEVPTEGVVLLDESSMIGTGLWKYIEKTNLQWIFIGDPAQLPPVKQKPSPALSCYGPELTEIVRQAKENPILQLATDVREGRPYLNGNQMNGECEGVGVTRDTNSFLASAKRSFLEADPEKPPPSRILAYRNVVVSRYNREIRSELLGIDDPKRFMEGDWLMMKDAYRDPETETLVVQNSEEVKVLDVELTEHYAPGGYWKAYELTVQRRDKPPAVIPVIHEDEESRRQEKISQFKSEAIKEQRPWDDYYGLIEAFPRLDYAYAMTVHKSQGSTFESAYVDHRDLLNCRKKAERRALVYVAATRPEKRLALLI